MHGSSNVKYLYFCYTLRNGLGQEGSDLDLGLTIALFSIFLYTGYVTKPRVFFLSSGAYIFINNE